MLENHTTILNVNSLENIHFYNQRNEYLNIKGKI